MNKIYIKLLILPIFLACLSALTLTSCGISDNYKPTPARTFNSGNLNGKNPSQHCSIKEKNSGTAWIRGQLDAIRNQDFKKAYEYASDNFKEMFSMSDLMLIIKSDYLILTKLKNFKIISCSKGTQYFTFQLDLSDTGNTKFHMDYVLSLINQKWGVDAAHITS